VPTPAAVVFSCAYAVTVPRFATYAPDERGGPPPEGLLTRPATGADAGRYVALRVERGDATPEQARGAFDRLLERSTNGDALLLMADVGGEVVGYGAADRLSHETIPLGWYLGGLIVAPAVRRRGIGARLTSDRLSWIAARAPEALYFVNETNRASIDLHARLGFVEVVRDVRVPGVTFTGGVGLLFRADLTRGTEWIRVRPPPTCGRGS
jgi:ribosomal protein S18 acetylase RimI-like enzyme